MLDIRRLALERWRNEKRRQKKNGARTNIKVSRPARRVIAQKRSSMTSSAYAYDRLKAKSTGRSSTSSISKAKGISKEARQGQELQRVMQLLLESVSDDGGKRNEDAVKATPGNLPGPRRVNVLIRKRKSDEDAEPVKAYKTDPDKEEGHVSTRETTSFRSIGAAFRALHDVLWKVNEN
ncbi:unnamed protein product [Peronospora effusa]|uniref:Uncharacterized protein n=1 Tax=Peronospora effusa TaxID=542832 RepID=A0A425CN88_9STRA|nr:hypothetical protein DD237_008293 [Peronospora effusa]CAI5725315.1 unnamed protein product [Peronospora effusa]